MTFSTYHKIFINVITNNIHRSPKLIPLSAFISAVQHGSISLVRATSSSCTWFCIDRGGEYCGWDTDSLYFPHTAYITFKQAQGLCLASWAFHSCGVFECLVRTFAFRSNSPQMNVYLGWWYLLIRSQFSFCALRCSLIYNRFLSFNALCSNVTLIIKGLISLTWDMPYIENIYVKLFQKVKEGIKKSYLNLFYSLFTSWSPSFSFFCHLPCFYIFRCHTFSSSYLNSGTVCAMLFGSALSCLGIVLVFCVFLCVLVCISPHQVYLGSSGHQKCVWINHHHRFFLCWFSLVSYKRLVFHLVLFGFTPYSKFTSWIVRHFYVRKCCIAIKIHKVLDYSLWIFMQGGVKKA